MRQSVCSILLILVLMVTYIQSASIQKATGLGYDDCDLKPALRLITYFKNDIDYTRVYQISICINSTYGDVCADGIDDYVALLFCQSESMQCTHQARCLYTIKLVL